MKNFYKTSLLLFIILIILGLIIFSINKKENSFFLFKNIKEINEIHFISLNKSLKIKKIKDNWKIIYPFNDLIDMDNLNNVFNNIKKINIKNSFASKNLNDFGLTNPTYSLIIFSQNKKNILKIGNKLSYDEKYYCMFNNKIFLINTESFNLIKNSFNDLRNKYIFNFDKSNIEKISFDDGEKFSLSRKNNIWNINYKDKIFKADQKKIYSFLDDVQFIKCNDFQDSIPSKKKYKKIKFISNQKKEFNYNFYTLKNQSFLIENFSRNAYMVLNNFPIKRIFKKYEYFINKKLLNFNPDKIKKIIFKSNNKKTVLSFNNFWTINGQKIKKEEDLESFLFLSSAINGDRLFNKKINQKPEIEISFFFDDNNFQNIKIIKINNTIAAVSNINPGLYFVLSNDYYSEILKIKNKVLNF